MNPTYEDVLVARRAALGRHFRSDLLQQLDAIDRRLIQIGALVMTLAHVRGEPPLAVHSLAGVDLPLDPDAPVRVRGLKVAALLTTGLGVATFAAIAAFTIAGPSWVVATMAAVVGVAISTVAAVLIRLGSQASEWAPRTLAVVRRLTLSAAAVVGVSLAFLIALRFASSTVLFELVSIDLAILESALLLSGAGLAVLYEAARVPLHLAVEHEKLKLHRTDLQRRLSALTSALESPVSKEVGHGDPLVSGFSGDSSRANGQSYVPLPDARH